MHATITPGCDTLLTSGGTSTREPSASTSSTAPFNGLDEFLAVLGNLEEVARKKGHDYGGEKFLGALESSYDLGVEPEMSCLLRAQQKWSRICNLVKNGEHTAQVAESIDETIDDMINYLIYVRVFRNKRAALRPTLVEMPSLEPIKPAAAKMPSLGPTIACEFCGLEPLLPTSSSHGYVYHCPNCQNTSFKTWDTEPKVYDSTGEVVGSVIEPIDLKEQRPFYSCPICSQTGVQYILLPVAGKEGCYMCINCQRWYTVGLDGTVISAAN